MRNPAVTGFTYIGLLFAIAFASVALVLTAGVWSTTTQREKEAQLLFAGGQLLQAIGRYYQEGPGPRREFPKSLDDLVLDRRYPFVRRYLRRIFVDPMTGKAEWGLVRNPDGGIIGVYSLSAGKAIRSRVAFVFGTPVGGSDKYSEWRFVYDSGTFSRNAALSDAAPVKAEPVATQQKPPATDSAGCRMVIVDDRLFCQEIK